MFTRAQIAFYTKSRSTQYIRIKDHIQYWSLRITGILLYKDSYGLRVELIWSTDLHRRLLSCSIYWRSIGRVPNTDIRTRTPLTHRDVKYSFFHIYFVILQHTPAIATIVIWQTMDHALTSSCIVCIRHRSNLVLQESDLWTFGISRPVMASSWNHRSCHQ